MANKIKDRLVSEWASDEKRTLLDLATGGRIKHTGVGKYKGQSGGAPEIKEKVVPVLEILTGISAVSNEGKSSLLNLAMSVPIFGGVLKLGKGIKTASQAVKYLRKALNVSSKEFKSIHKMHGGDPFKLRNKLVSEIGELQKVAVKESPISKGIKLGGRQGYIPGKKYKGTRALEKGETYLREGKSGRDIYEAKKRLPMLDELEGGEW